MKVSFSNLQNKSLRPQRVPEAFFSPNLPNEERICSRPDKKGRSDERLRVKNRSTFLNGAVFLSPMDHVTQPHPPRSDVPMSSKKTNGW